MYLDSHKVCWIYSRHCSNTRCHCCHLFVRHSLQIACSISSTDLRVFIQNKCSICRIDICEYYRLLIIICLFFILIKDLIVLWLGCCLMLFLFYFVFVFIQIVDSCCQTSLLYQNYLLNWTSICQICSYCVRLTLWTSTKTSYPLQRHSRNSLLSSPSIHSCLCTH